MVALINGCINKGNINFYDNNKKQFGRKTHKNQA